MDMTTTTTTTTTTAVTAAKSPEAESETPPLLSRIQTTKPLSFSNGVLKRHHHAPPVCGGGGGVTYKECLKNHAASLGGHALDGCGEFMPAPTATATDPTSLKCAACGCHRNFHRREPEDYNYSPATVSPVIEYHPHHRHHPPPPPSQAPCSPGSQSPPPISSSYYPGSAPHMLLALSGGGSGPHEGNNHHHGHHLNLVNSSGNPSRKRFRTKFSQEQKDRMYEFAEKVGWKMLKTNEDMVNGFCSEIGVERGVFKVWMHNNKNSFGKRSGSNGAPTGGEQEHGNGNGHSTSSHNIDEEAHQHRLHLQQRQQQLFGSHESNANAPTNASSSSS